MVYQYRIYPDKKHNPDGETIFWIERRPLLDGNDWQAVAKVSDLETAQRIVKDMVVRDR